MQHAFRSALGAFATGVTVVTARTAAGHDIGRTASSFNSVSLDPPMVLWSLSKTSSMFQDFRDADHYAVHVLTADQQDLALRFAGKCDQPFEDLSLTRGIADLPLLETGGARFECRTAQRYDGGDHAIFLGEVLNFSGAAGQPLIFHAGQFARLAA